MLRRMVLVAALCAAALPALAALGDNEASIAGDQAKFRASRKAAVTHPGYRMEEMDRADGTAIREYVASSGTVFAVSWRGPTLPDLSQLLGSNFAEFQNNVQHKAGHRKFAVVRTGDLVVESSGHMRAFYGRAYLKSQLPAGVAIEAVQ